MTAGPQPPTGDRRVDIQGLRAAAVILVVLFHSGLTARGGYVGVDVFFVISGFVITRLLWRELRSTGTLSLRTFYTRRVRRLLPALALLLAVVALGSLALQSPLGTQQQTATVGMASSVFSANVALFFQGGGGYFALPSNSMPLLHLWTLAVEEQFYLFFPLALLLGSKLAGRRGQAGGRRQARAVTVTVLVIIVASFAVSWWATFQSGELNSRFHLHELAFFGSPMRAWEFALGSLLAVAEPTITKLDRRVAIVAGLAGAGLVGYAAVHFTGTTPFPGSAALYPVLGAVLLIVAGTPTQQGLPRLLSLRPVVWVGDVSYGWYLWHWPAIVFVRAVDPGASNRILFAAAVASLLPTWLSYRFVENPVRLDPRFAGRRVVLLGLGCCTVPLVLFGALSAYARHPQGVMADLVHQNRFHVDVTHGCLANLPGTAQTDVGCTWRVPRAKGTIYLIGDSNAGQFGEVAAQAANRAGYDLTLATYGSCQFGDLLTRSPGYATEVCRQFVWTWARYLHRNKPSLVILANESAGAIRVPSVTFEDPHTHEIARTVETKTRMWQRGLTTTLRGIAGSGSHVVVINTVPQWGMFDLRACPGYRIYLDAARCGHTESKARAATFLRPALVAERAATASVPNTSTVSFLDQICPGTRCETDRDGFWVYRDGAHLTVDGALLLAPRFDDLVQRLARPRSGD